MTRTLGILATALLPAILLAQEPPPAPAPEDPALVEQRQAVERLFEAGQYPQVIAAAASPDTQPAVVYMAAQSLLKGAPSPQQLQQAVQTFQRLEARPAQDPWHFIGMSGRQVVQNQLEPAVASARQAITLDPTFGVSHYQLGLVLARAQRWPEAAAAFEAAAMRRPGHAYTHYYAGLMYYRAGRQDQMAAHFDQFLKLAPSAPERPEVQSIMRTIRR